MPDEAQQQTEVVDPLGEPEPALEAETEAETGAGAGLESEPEAGDAVPEPRFSWQASEYVHHHKSPLWYAVLFLGVLVLVSAAVWLRLWLEIGVFLAMGAAIIVYAGKPPRTLLYELGAEGVKIDGKTYVFEDFRSFGVVEDEEWHSIDLEPARRFSPRLVLLFDSSNLDEIVGHLEAHLPRLDRDPDLIERITRYVRF